MYNCNGCFHQYATIQIEVSHEIDEVAIHSSDIPYIEASSLR